MLDREPGRADEHELLDARGEADRHLGPDEAAHRVADDHGPLDPERVQQLVDDAAVARDRDLLGGHGGVAEPRQVHRDDAVVAGEVGDVLQPVDPCARQAVDEDERIPFADVDGVDGRARHLHPALVLAPVDVHPRRAALGPIVVQYGDVRLRSDVCHAE
jgi:hypothetical protein